MNEIITSAVQYESDGDPIKAYMAHPSTSNGQRPAVVVVHEWWGLNSHIKDVANRFARQGYIALAPDLYSRKDHVVTEDAQEAARLMSELSSQAVLKDLNRATSFLKDHSDVDPWRIGAIGFSMGGTFVLTMACHNSDIKASVPFYGKVPMMDQLKYLVCPVQFHWAAKDTWVTKADITQLKMGLDKFGMIGELHTYEEAEHAFFNDTLAEVYREADAKNAWERTLGFFAKHLR